MFEGCMSWKLQQNLGRIFSNDDISSLWIVFLDTYHVLIDIIQNNAALRSLNVEL